MVGNRNYLRLDSLSRIPWLVHGFGLSGFTLEALKQEPGMSAFQPVELKQEHSARVLLINGAQKSRQAGDALVTAKPGLLLLIKTADCLPLFFVDLEHWLVAAVHGGWRGTSGRIAAAAFDLMKKSFGSRPEKVLAALGPAIEARCYEVGREVYDLFSRQGFPPEKIFLPGQKAGRFFLNLRAANMWLLTEALGFPQENIFSLDLCTFCQPELLSHRRRPEEKARLINFIGIKVNSQT
ncbi:MAG: peptidoglycan editing factor PgeF [Acidobacteriota bacterium]|nr:peptidoglycan editing factor PgeF [Acidobacteriota bacterium]